MRKIVETHLAPKPIGCYSQAVIVDKFIYLSGQIGLDPMTNRLVSAHLKEQTEQVFSNLEAILVSANYRLEDIIKLTIYLTDINSFAVVNEVMEKKFQHVFPARATLEVSALPKGALVEIEGIGCIES